MVDQLVAFAIFLPARRSPRPRCCRLFALDRARHAPRTGTTRARPLARTRTAATPAPTSIPPASCSATWPDVDVLGVVQQRYLDIHALRRRRQRDDGIGRRDHHRQRAAHCALRASRRRTAASLRGASRFRESRPARRRRRSAPPPRSGGVGSRLAELRRVAQRVARSPASPLREKYGLVLIGTSAASVTAKRRAWPARGARAASGGPVADGVTFQPRSPSSANAGRRRR